MTGDKTIQLTLTEKQQQCLEFISHEISNAGADDSFALEEALDFGLESYLYHLIEGGGRVAMKP